MGARERRTEKQDGALAQRSRAHTRSCGVGQRVRALWVRSAPPDAPPPVLHAVRMCLSLVTLTVWGTVGGVSRAAGEAFIFAVIIGNALLFILAALLIQPQQATAKAAKH